MEKILEATLIEKGINVQMYNDGYTSNESRFGTAEEPGETFSMFYILNEFITNNSDSDDVVANSIHTLLHTAFDIKFARSVYEQLKI